MLQCQIESVIVTLHITYHFHFDYYNCKTTVDPVLFKSFLCTVMYMELSMEVEKKLGQYVILYLYKKKKRLHKQLVCSLHIYEHIITKFMFLLIYFQLVP